jgi:chromosome segregation ATPase
LVFVPLFSFGQIKKDTTQMCFPYSVGKQIALDLNKLDQLTELVKLTEKELKETQNKVEVQSNIIETMELKEDNYELQIQKEEEKFKIVEDENNGLRKDIKKLKTKNTIIEIVGGAIVGALTYIVVFK